MPPTRSSISGSALPGASVATGLARAWTTGRPDLRRRRRGATVEGAAPVDDDARAAVKRFNATLIAYLFLLYFDTRVGAGDTGPYRLPDGRALLVRDYYQLGCSDFWWSDVAEGVPYRDLTAALVLDGVSIDRVTDSARATRHPRTTSIHLVAFGLFTTDGVASVNRDPSRRQPYPRSQRPSARHNRPSSCRGRHGSPREDPAAAYVYFSFLRPFEHGTADDFDWSALATSPVRSTSSCRPWRVTTRVSPTTGRTTSP